MKRLNRIADGVKPATIKMAGLDWRSQYGCYSTIVAGWVPLGLTYTPRGYIVTIAGYEMKTRPASLEEAADHAVSVLRAWSSKLALALKPGKINATEGYLPGGE